LTPIVYPIAILPDTVKDIVLNWNPMSTFIVAYQRLLLSGTLPAWMDYSPYFFLAILLLAIGFFAYIKLSAEMIDEL
jgi:lipopolysaccharide transport system permease protein